MRRPIRPWLMLFVLVVGFLVVAGLSVLLRPDLVPPSVRTTFSPSPGPVAQILYRAESNSPFETGPPDREIRDAWFKTALAMITSPSVLATVASDSVIEQIDVIREAASPEDAIREALFIRTIGEGTNLIEVSSRGLPPREAATLINAVVDAWLRSHRRLNNEMHRQSTQELDAYLDDLSHEAESLSQTLITLGTLQLEPEGPSLARATAEAELLDCLGRLRDLRLERADLGDDPANADALASIDRREALLIADRDRIAYALNQSSDVALNALQDELDSLNQKREQVRNRLKVLQFEAERGDQFLVLSLAQP